MKIQTLVKILVLQVFVSTTCFAQVSEKGYVVTNANDTLRGLVVMSKEMKSVNLSADKETKFSAQDVKSVKLESGTYYISHDSVDNSYAFLEVLLSGKVSLYKHTERLFMKSVSDNKLYELTQKTTTKYVNGVEMTSTSKPYLGVLTFMLLDCPKTNQARIKRVSLNEIEVTKLIKEYYSCTNQEVVDHKEGKKNLAINLGMVLNPGISIFGLVRQNASSSPSDISGDEEWDKKIFLSGGFVAELYSERTGGKFGYRQEILFAHHNRYGKRENYSEFYDDESLYIDIKTNLLQANFLLNYKFLQKSEHAAFLFVGPSFNYLINSSDSKLYEYRLIPTGSYDSYKIDNSLKPRKIYFGGLIGVGYEIISTTDYKLLAETRAGYSTSNYSNGELYQNEVNIQLGVSFFWK